MEQKDWILRLLYFARNLRSQKMFEAIKRVCVGDVLDVGGLDFFLTAKSMGFSYKSWTSIEPSEEAAPLVNDPGFRFVKGDGCNMVEFSANTFDTALCLQVVEHVFEPIAMVNEIHRVLRPGGHAIFLVPQTSMLHMAPHHYYNFTRYWIEEVMKRAGFEILELKPLGGYWSSVASRSLYFFLQVLRYPGMHVPEKRTVLFALLMPLKIVTALALIPWGMLLSLGDSTEEPNNHFVVVRKKSSKA